VFAALPIILFALVVIPSLGDGKFSAGSIGLLLFVTPMIAWPLNRLNMANRMHCCCVRANAGDVILPFSGKLD
jgi:hypothetical protein